VVIVQNDYVTGIFSHSLISFSVSAIQRTSGFDCIRCIRLRPEIQASESESEDAYVQETGERICRFLDGLHDDFLDLQLDFSGLTFFQIRVLEAARKISRGSPVTYSELAKNAGYPYAVRAVASVMRANRFPLIIPCHRVVRKDGSSGGYCGQQDGRMVALKESLLKLEQKN
jgi:O-6-methylguanine DNA methyltransferase